MKTVSLGSTNDKWGAKELRLPLYAVSSVVRNTLMPMARLVIMLNVALSTTGPNSIGGVALSHKILKRIIVWHWILEHSSSSFQGRLSQCQNNEWINEDKIMGSRSDMMALDPSYRCQIQYARARSVDANTTTSDNESPLESITLLLIFGPYSFFRYEFIMMATIL